MTSSPAPTRFDTPSELSGIELLQAFQSGALPLSPMGQTVGWRYVHVEPGLVRLVVTPGRHLYNPTTVHGGAMAAMMDAALWAAVASRLPAGAHVVTVDLKTTFVAAPKRDCGELTITGRAIDVRRSLGMAEGRIEDAHGKLYCHGTATLNITRRKADGSGDEG